MNKVDNTTNESEQPKPMSKLATVFYGVCLGGIAICLVLLVVLPDSGSSDSQEVSSNSHSYSIEDCVKFLQTYDIESFSSDYKTYYSDGTLGMSEGKMSIVFNGSQVKYQACKPVSYTVSKNEGGDGVSTYPYFSIVFQPNCTRGDELILQLLLNKEGKPDLLCIRSKIYDSYTALKGSGNPEDRKVVSGPSLKVRKR